LRFIPTTASQLVAPLTSDKDEFYAEFIHTYRVVNNISRVFRELIAKTFIVYGCMPAHSM